MELFLYALDTLIFFYIKPSAWMISTTPMALLVYVMMSLTFQPKPWFLLWAHAHGKHSLLKTMWIPHKKLEFSVSKAKFIVSSPISHIQPILCLLCFLILGRHYQPPNCCFSQRAMYHSSPSCFYAQSVTNSYPNSTDLSLTTHLIQAIMIYY